ncbi:hypothetical protein [Streptomyces mexicanus]|jgi:hypothetical protein|uniref:Uncharacterized protein n=1 Tax=Streptomyces mexicanus TaxID=178566 RepID=A0A7X1I1T0_9ACTN|nr:hypothetical protein [Streptomyces mexicanus]MBC2866916.1 hypothetical protein [Streptomyces mexicanus]
MSEDAVYVRGVTGIQLHHVTDIQDAGRFLGNAVMALRAAFVRTGDERYSGLSAEVSDLLAKVRGLENAARGNLHALHSRDPERFVRCREGDEPWPDEIEAGFIPRHTCRDTCLYHDHDVLDAITQCICGRPPCRACVIGGEPAA